jgi:deoxyribodipyrimidine photo-lyase
LWLNRDLRLGDHAALQAALATGQPVVPVYIHDDETEGRRPLGGASRWWLHESLKALDADLRKRGSRLVLARGPILQVLVDMVRECNASALFWSRGYQGWGVKLERDLHRSLEGDGVRCRRFSGTLLYEPEDIATGAGEPFRVFTPFSRACLKRGDPAKPLAAPTSLPPVPDDIRSDRLESWNLLPASPDWAGGIRAAWKPGEAAAREGLQEFLKKGLAAYKTMRDLPGVEGTSRLSPHLHFGEISPRQVWYAAKGAAFRSKGKADAGTETFLKELLWREFSAHMLFHWPQITTVPFRAEFGGFPFANDARALDAWQQGRTGYPIVDAGMRELWVTGWMYNRVRMIVASFLVKDLMIPWQRGEEWFWDTLVDADAASNAANWQWVAGSGSDAAPYFRIFNPVLQGKKFDPEGDYVKAWAPELAKLPKSHLHAPWEAPETTLQKAGVELGETYPKPIVDHKVARERALEAFEAIRKDKA